MAPGRRERTLGILFVVLGIANAIVLDERAWGIGSGVVFLILGIAFLRKGRREAA